jgi:hypothetical protein
MKKRSHDEVSSSADSDRPPPATRPARRQVDSSLPASEPDQLSRDDVRQLRATYGNASEGGPSLAALSADGPPAHARPAATRCHPARDAGATEGEAEGQTLFCLDSI